MDDEYVKLWSTSLVTPPEFPVIYLDILGAKEIRGFLLLNHLLGDIDFSAYENDGVIIDVRGYLYRLRFIRKTKFVGILHPGEPDKKLTINEVRDAIRSALLFCKDQDLINVIDSSDDVSLIISTAAEKYSW